MISTNPFDWNRSLRTAVTLPTASGVYALFQRKESTLPGVKVKEGNLLYIGKAGNKQGLRGRCHFDAKTKNHSPRKSLAVMLMGKLGLIPVLVTKPNSRDTWGLDPASENKLSAWMHSNLELALMACENQDELEDELVARHAPPLNLNKCVQSEQHRKISELRSEVFSNLKRESTR